MKNSKSLYLFVIVFCLVLISSGIYYLLGGFKKLEVYFFDGSERTVIGKEFFIRDGNKDFNTKMDSVALAIKSGTLKGDLTAVIYDDDWKERDSLHVFIGAAQHNASGIMQIPAGYTYKEFSSSRVYKVFISQNGWVRPSTDEVEEVLEIKAIEEGEVFQPITFEVYFQDGSFNVEKWIE